MSKITEQLSDMVEVTRCYECELCVSEDKNGRSVKCVTGRYHEPTWYCADGVKRKENETEMR